MEPNKQPEREKTSLQGTWLALIDTTGRYLVRTSLGKGAIQAAHRAGEIIEVDEAFELTSQLQVGQGPQGEMNVGKLNIACRIDAMLYPAKMYFPLQGRIYYIDDLSESDAAAYKDLIQGATRLAEGWQQGRVRASSGIVIPGANSPHMPGRRG